MTATPVSRSDVEDLLVDYAIVLDDGPLEAWPELFTEAASYRIVARENHDRGLPLATMRCDSRAMMVDRVTAIRRLSMYAPRSLRHLITGVRVESAADREAQLRASYAVLETKVEAETTVLSTGRYLGRVARGDNGVRFSELIVVYDSTLIDTSLVWPL